MTTATEIQLGRVVGMSVDRKEDMALLTGQAKYVDDMSVPGMVWMSVVRSPYAHARIRGVDTSKAAAMPGCIAAWSGADLASDWAGPLVCAWPVTDDIKMSTHWPVAQDKARFAGDAVAVVVPLACAGEGRGRARRGRVRAAAFGDGCRPGARRGGTPRPRRVRHEPLLHVVARGR